MMLDLAGIVFSSVMILYMIVRAVRLDALTPWFEAPKARADDTQSADGVKRRGVSWRERRQ